jgi:Lrp/AsnC family leucine-responsive transcriptional regulator
MKNFDAADRTLLLSLQHDARQTMAELAEQVSLSHSPCWRRVKLLEETGVIEGYHAHLNRAKVGFGVTGFIHLQMERHTPEIAAAFEREVAAMQLVVSCHNLSGHYDYMLEVVGSDLESFSSFVRNKIRCLPGVKEISTSFSLNEIKRSNVMPLE